jgi:thymidine phosphorylase
LAQSIASVANGAGLKTVARITDMNEPLANCAGNALEVRHAILHLKGEAIDQRLHDVTFALCADMLVLGGLARDEADAMQQLDSAWRSGRAAEIFAQMVTALGGPAQLVDDPDRILPQAPLRRLVKTHEAGFIASINTRAIGVAVLELGGGRRRAADSINFAVGVSDLARCGARLEKGDGLALIHARDDDSAARAEAIVRKAYSLAQDAPAPMPLLVEKLTG